MCCTRCSRRRSTGRCAASSIRTRGRTRSTTSGWRPDRTPVTTFIARRFAASVVVLFGVSIVVFLTLKLIPGDAAFVLAGPNASAEDIERVRQSLGLDQPIPTQYLTWLGRTLRGDLGRSLELHEPVLGLVLARYGNTLLLASAAMLFAGITGVFAGTVAALRPHSLLDRVVMVITLMANSTPSF